MIVFQTPEGIDFELTKHATQRIQQRGVTHETVAFVLRHADIRLHAGENCKSLRISHQQMARLAKKGTKAALMARARTVVVVVKPTAAEIITVLHDWGDKCGRRYRRQWPTRSEKSSRRRRQRKKELQAASLVEAYPCSLA
jgi:hypothetical protein